MASNGIEWHRMASNGKKKSKEAKRLSKRNSLAPGIGRANSTARKLHASADAAHHQARQAHKRAESAHKKADSLHALRAQAAESPVGKARPPKAPLDYDPAEQKTGGPALSTTLSDRATSRLPFAIAGIGASAGGLEALSDLLAHLPRETGMAIVILQHLDPTHESHLGQLLARATKIPVLDIATGMRPEPDFIYVLPANASVTLRDGQFKLGGRLPANGPMMPIDVFFRSLAIEQQHRAIGVVLSGMGSDGTLGLQEIKGQGGITFAQDHATARHFPMPGSAIAAGCVDFVLAPDALARELERVARHPYVATESAPTRPKRPKDPLPDHTEPVNLLRSNAEEMRTLFILLRTRTGVDFSLYKPGTLHRRIMRRMVLRKINLVSDYVKFLQESTDEIEALFGDLLISVTGFFRDPSAFQTLQKKIFPRLVKNRPDDAPVRIWTCGCSTGEEAYSLAIAISEFMEKSRKRYPVQIFASDINDRGLERARAGLYQENIMLDVPPERLRRYFTKVEGFYQVSKSIRDMCVFARQNVAIDPPFSNLDLISCRNVLIYLTPALQKRVMPIFHNALKPNGVLFLGTSENIGEASLLFDQIDKRHKFFARKSTPYRPAVDVGRFAPREVVAIPARGPERPNPEVEVANVQLEVDRLILTRYSPAGVVINSKMDVLHFRGQTAPFLEHQQGTASLNLLKMVRDELTLDVRRAVSKAIQTGERVEHLGPRIEVVPGHASEVTIEVHPVNALSELERHFLVLFRYLPGAGLDDSPAASAPRRGDTRTIAKLRDELASTKQSLQVIIEEQDATNEELKSANEEIQSSNEELQSTNEELETAREELQSTNEELTTLNQELQARNLELGQLNNDLANLLNSVNVALVILGTDMTVRRFTPLAEKLFNLIPSDVGRRFTDLTRKVNVPDLESIIDEVIEHLTAVEREVQDGTGKWYSLRVRPYRTQESRIDGVVLMLLDINEIKGATSQIMAVARHPMLALYADLKVKAANEAFYRTFELPPNEVEERLLYRLGKGAWEIPKLRTLLEEILPQQMEVRDFLLEGEFPRIGPRKMLVNARRFYEESQGVQLILIGMEDVTDRS
jgi:two-component system CheB/CheR fusion protein